MIVFDNIYCRYWQIFRPDFQRVLVEHAVKLGVEIQYDCRVVNVDCEGGSPALENGLKLNSDLVICADGETILF